MFPRSPHIPGLSLGSPYVFSHPLWVAFDGSSYRNPKLSGKHRIQASTPFRPGDRHRVHMTRVQPIRLSHREPSWRASDRWCFGFTSLCRVMLRSPRLFRARVRRCFNRLASAVPPPRWQGMCGLSGRNLGMPKLRGKDCPSFARCLIRSCAARRRASAPSQGMTARAHDGMR